MQIFGSAGGWLFIIDLEYLPSIYRVFEMLEMLFEIGYLECFAFINGVLLKHFVKVVC